MTKTKRFIAQLEDGARIDSTSLTDENFDIVSISEEIIHVLYKNKSYTAQILSRDIQSKTYTIDIAGTQRTIVLKDELDILVDKMGMNAGTNVIVKDLKAPMPGLILRLESSAGKEVAEGDNLFILEAMKMENIIKSPRSGKISKIHVEQGEKVDKGQLVISFE